MTKLLQINVSANWGSHGRIAEDIGRLMMAQGWESYIAYGRYANASTSQLLKISNSFDVCCHALQTRLFDSHGLGSSAATHRLIKQIDKIKPDLIHLHNIHGYFANYRILFNYLAQIDTPVVWTLHDCWPFTGHCAFYTAAKCHKWHSGCNDCPSLGEYPASWGADRSARNYVDKQQAFTSLRNLYIVAVSDWLAGELRQSFLRNIPIETIRNGVDTKVFAPKNTTKTELGLEEKFTILGVANVWDSRKGFNDFIELRQLLPDDYQIVMLGLNRKQIAQLPKGIVGIEHTQNIDELVALYSVADAFVCASHEDNYPSVILEAISCGTPVVTYPTGGCPEALTTEVGIVVNNHNCKSLAEALLSQALRNINRNKCRQHALENLENSKCFSRYTEIYERILHKT